MTELIKEPRVEFELVIDKPTYHSPILKTAPKPPSRQPISLSGIGFAAFAATALYLSAQSNYLFFKELLIVYSIVGMALLLGASGQSKSAASKPDTFDPRLN